MLSLVARSIQVFKEISITPALYLVCGSPYFTPTPTLGRALTTFFTAAVSGNANITAAAKHTRENKLNDWHFRPQCSSVKDILGPGQPGLMR